MLLETCKPGTHLVLQVRIRDTCLKCHRLDQERALGSPSELTKLSPEWRADWHPHQWFSKQGPGPPAWVWLEVQTPDLVTDLQLGDLEGGTHNPRCHQPPGSVMQANI